MHYLEKIESFKDRMFAYRFLAQAYKTAPNKAFLESLLTLDESVDAPLVDAINAMRGKDLEAIRHDLGAEYNRVFLNMGPDPLAPYESVYTSPEGLLMQDARDQVLALYRKESLAPANDMKIPEDHIALEFEYMAFLCEKAAHAAHEENAGAMAEYEDKQKVFLKDHLLIWIPTLCDDMEKRVKTKFYQEICAMTRTQLTLDAKWCKEF